MNVLSTCMSAEDVLPEGVCSSLAQLVECATADPGDVASNDFLVLKLAALRRCFDGAVSRVLTARNAKRLMMPDDIWLLVLEHLPLDDLLSASRTCRAWRAVSLADSRLWTRLILHVYDQRSSKCSTNIGVLKNILSRAHEHKLELEVRIGAFGAAYGYGAVIKDILELLAPRLIRLNLVSTDASWTVGVILDAYPGVFPQLRKITLPSPWCAGRPSRDDCCTVTLRGECAPGLVELDLRADIWVTCYESWPALRILRCACRELEELEDLLLSARNLQRLVLDWICEPSDWHSNEEPLGAALLAALRVVPDVDITTELTPAFQHAVFDIFGGSPAPRLGLAFDTCGDYVEGPLRPRPFSRLLSAVHLTISVRGDDTVIVADDGADRETVISLRGVSPTNALHPAIDWAMIPSLEALEQLSVDAALWPDFMHNFPRCPRLSGITLAVRTLDDIQAVLAVDQQGLPQAESLNLMLEPDVELAEDRVDALKTVFGASHVALY